MKIGRLVVRAVVGGLFIGHGTQKLFGWFGGPGLSGTEQTMEKLRLQPARYNALAAGAGEAVGGALLVAGLATPVAAASLIGVMITAMRTVHVQNGPWNSSGGYEYNLVLIAALLGLVDGGPGELSIDRAFGLHDTGPAWALGALALGAGASTLTIELGHRQANAIEAASDDLAARDIAGDQATETR
jgi:putative oxidoreductase